MPDAAMPLLMPLPSFDAFTMLPFDDCRHVTPLRQVRHVIDAASVFHVAITRCSFLSLMLFYDIITYDYCCAAYFDAAYAIATLFERFARCHTSDYLFLLLRHYAIIYAMPPIYAMPHLRHAAFAFRYFATMLC